MGLFEKYLPGGEHYEKAKNAVKEPIIDSKLSDSEEDKRTGKYIEKVLSKVLLRTDEKDNSELTKEFYFYSIGATLINEIKAGNLIIDPELKIKKKLIRK